MENKIIAFLMAIFASTTLFAAGNEGTGGGDPLAYEFIQIAGPVAQYLIEKPDIAASASREKMNSWIVEAQMSLLNDEKTSLIEVVEDRPADSHGVAKAALFNRETKQLKLHRATWVASTPKEKASLVTMELLGFAGLRVNRYAHATDVSEKSESIFADAAKRKFTCQSSVSQIKSAFSRSFSAMQSCLNKSISKTEFDKSQKGLNLSFVILIQSCDVKSDVSIQEAIRTWSPMYQRVSKLHVDYSSLCFN